MLWTSWPSLVTTVLISSAVIAWWFTESKNTALNLVAACSLFASCWAVAPDRVRVLATSLHASALNTITTARIDLWAFRHASMLLTGGAVFWLVQRAWQTLWKPVPELISILGVDVPDPPEVSLAGIKPNSATVNWTRAPPNRSVQKFLIQVNGVVVGDVPANQDPAIVVSGLKPDHFYNVRVIAVGSNNFQAGSRVVRLRTFAQDGRPQLGNARLPSSFTIEEPNRTKQSEPLDENASSRPPIPALETATALEGVAPSTRDGLSAAAAGPRRNTVTRRHSPSTTSLDQSLAREESAEDSTQTLPELTQRFESIRKETEEVTQLITKEDDDIKRLLNELEAEKQEKRREQKKKEEQTEKLRRDVNLTDRVMRNALSRKAHKEKAYKEKQNEHAKLHDDIAKWEEDIEDMRKGREGFEQETKDLQESHDEEVAQLRDTNSDLAETCVGLEAKLKELREEVRALEEARKKLPGGEEDAEWREKEAELRRNWHRRHRDLQETMSFETRTTRRLDDHIRSLAMQIQQIPPATFGLYSQANTSGLEFESAGALGQTKRRSRTTSSLANVSVPSPLPAYSQLDPAIPVNSGYASARSANVPPGFAPGPFMMGLSADMQRHDENSRAASAPLSPSATALLPSNILDDMDDDGPSPTARYVPDNYLQQSGNSLDNEPQSPTSSGESPSLLGSPHGSSSNLAFPTLTGDQPDNRSLNAITGIGSPSTAVGSERKIGSLFSFPRTRAAKVMETEGPMLGSLKGGQSQSFPRQTDDDALAKSRRISLSGTWNVFNRHSATPELLEGPAPASRMFSTRSFNPFASSSRPAAGIFGERDPSSPRPASIASNEFPRPSTESGSIWGPPLASDGTGLVKTGRIWPQDAPWSRNPSRRPSLHGSPSALKTTLASADDEILDEGPLPNVHEVGVIGRPPPQHASKDKNKDKDKDKAMGRLNPNAPAFSIGSLFKKEKEKDGSKKAKDKGKDKTAKNKDSGAASPGHETPIVASIEMLLESPTESRKSRDGMLLEPTRTSVSMTESHDSLSLDHSFSNTPSEALSTGLAGSFKEDNVVRKLFRKGSSGKFSLAGRSGGGLFKKGPGSTASASDRGVSIGDRSSMDNLEDLGEDAFNPAFLARSYESVTSSPNVGPSASASNVKDKSVKENKAPGVSWLNFGKKGKKERESVELEREKSQVLKPEV
ncbi:hypothetical protein SMACR_02867 [Sordaria macrospora]|uniref:WGS project CABT00000000 data, contig 2.12 n=2 Tax=Sordaria macrospora TaxID=5147 RepID=F7VXP6_SORMK|nr:uncharacterized protein SMAC_02867 [Sordaria macrospora k-hell]KAA8632838.1 hypothetical protein SMACR_02867 [Sordaria macrospora]KAH7635017.1 hypothetical protein B0T09DRAFT_389156 [Sordaria sp. MPI-SDFR-AT-0083]WPJ58221.1 hypothetical protein SMAC4_02867 [Sordaria macrospora]CCC10290.1 unnamed protein product [Sordaria macrospora k-hell]